MNAVEVPGVRYELSCSNCGGVAPVILFQASYYDFETFLGTGTGSLYRLSLDHIHYTGATEDQMLAEARARETKSGGQLVRARDIAVCSSCQTKMPGIGSPETYPVGNEVRVNAICIDA